MNFTNTGEVRYEIGEEWKSAIVQQWCGMERDRGVVEFHICWINCLNLIMSSIKVISTAICDWLIVYKVIN